MNAKALCCKSAMRRANGLRSRDANVKWRKGKVRARAGWIERNGKSGVNDELWALFFTDAVQQNQLRVNHACDVAPRQAEKSHTVTYKWPFGRLAQRPTALTDRVPSLTPCHMHRYLPVYVKRAENITTERGVAAQRLTIHPMRAYWRLPNCAALNIFMPGIHALHARAVCKYMRVARLGRSKRFEKGAVLLFTGGAVYWDPTKISVAACENTKKNH